MAAMQIPRATSLLLVLCAFGCLVDAANLNPPTFDYDAMNPGEEVDGLDEVERKGIPLDIPSEELVVADKSDDVVEMQKFLDDYDRDAKKIYNMDANREWDYLVNMTSYNMKLMVIESAIFNI